MSNDVVISKELRDDLARNLAEETRYPDGEWAKRFVDALRAAPETVSLEGVDERSLKLWNMSLPNTDERMVRLSDLRRLVAPVQSGGVDLIDVIETSRMVQVDINGRTAMYWDDWVAHLHDAFDDDLTTTQSAPSVPSVNVSQIRVMAQIRAWAVEYVKFGDPNTPYAKSFYEDLERFDAMLAHLTERQGGKA